MGHPAPDLAGIYGFLGGTVHLRNARALSLQEGGLCTKTRLEEWSNRLTGSHALRRSGPEFAEGVWHHVEDMPASWFVH